MAEQIEVIDLDGDILIDCAGTTTFLVSSKAISLASPVLRELLKPQTEGGIAIKGEFENFHQITLSQDDSVAFRLFCEVAHHQPSEVSAPPSPETTGHLVRLIEKYRCAHAMKDRGRLWLSCSRKGQPNEHLWKYLELAYILGLKKHFDDISRELLCGTNDRFRSLYSSFESPIPEIVLDLFDEKRDVLKTKINSALMCPVLKLSETARTRTQTLIVDYLKCLNAIGLLPGHDKFKDTSLIQIQLRARDQFAGHGSKADLLARLDKCAVGIGLCLQCVKSGRGHCDEHP